MILTLGQKPGVYFGSREIWLKLFNKFNLTHGKLEVKLIDFEETSDPDVLRAKMMPRPIKNAQ